MNNNKKLRSTLREMKKIFGNIPHWFIGSVVLGCVRNNGFIKGEHEIDYIIHYKDLKKVIKRLEKIGKVEVSSEAVKDNIVLRPIDGTNIIRVIKFYLDEVPVDIAIGHIFDENFYYLVKGDYYAVNKFPKKLFGKMIMTKFEGGIYSMPNTPLEYVETVYGKDWNIVKNDWSCAVDPPCIIRDEREANKVMDMIKERCDE